MGEREEFAAEAKRHYAAGLVHGALAREARPNTLSIEAHYEGTTPTGDLVVRVPVIGGVFLLRLESIDEEPF